MPDAQNVCGISFASIVSSIVFFYCDIQSPDLLLSFCALLDNHLILEHLH